MAGAVTGTDSARYDRAAMAMHWAVALAVVAQFAWGWWMLSVSASPPGPRAAAFNAHKSLGLVLLLLMALRFGWRLRHPPPPLPAIPEWQRKAASANHRLLYGALIAMAVVGYLGSVFSGYPVKFFGWPLPPWGARDAALKETFSRAHLALSWILATAVLLHLAAVIRHQWVGRIDVLARMLPGARRLPLRQGDGQNT